MKRHYHLLTTRELRSGAFVLAFLGISLLAGCYLNYAGYGRYRPSRQVDNMFESHQVPSEYSYYYTGSEKNPDAIIGLDPSYTLDSDNDLWEKAGLSATRLRRWVDEITDLRGYSFSVYGSYMLDPDGKIIGIYYSKWEGGPIVMQSGRKVTVHMPDTRPGRNRAMFTAQREIEP